MFASVYYGLDIKRCSIICVIFFRHIFCKKKDRKKYFVCSKISGFVVFVCVFFAVWIIYVHAMERCVRSSHAMFCCWRQKEIDRKESESVSMCFCYGFFCVCVCVQLFFFVSMLRMSACWSIVEYFNL